MDFERGIEFNSPKPVNKESSYSEEEQAKILEGAKIDTKQISNKRKPASSRKERIIIAYRANLEKILGLVEAISELEGKNSRQEEQLIEEIKLLRKIQEELLSALLLEEKGMLIEESISKETWNLIQ